MIIFIMELGVHQHLLGLLYCLSGIVRDTHSGIQYNLFSIYLHPESCYYGQDGDYAAII